MHAKGRGRCGGGHSVLALKQHRKASNNGLKLKPDAASHRLLPTRSGASQSRWGQLRSTGHLPASDGVSSYRRLVFTGGAHE